MYIYSFFAYLIPLSSRVWRVGGAGQLSDSIQNYTMVTLLAEHNQPNKRERSTVTYIIRVERLIASEECYVYELHLPTKETISLPRRLVQHDHCKVRERSPIHVGA